MLLPCSTNYNFSAHLHHKTPADCVEGVTADAGGSGHSLSDGPLGNDVGVLLVLEEHSLCHKTTLHCRTTISSSTLHETGMGLHTDAT